jgi:CBS domain containing-hemolysin-like protein
MEDVIYFLVLLLLTLLGGYFAAAEVALFSLPVTRVKSFQSDSDPRKRLIAQLLHQPRDLLVTVFMLNTLLCIVAQNVASQMFGSDASWLLKVGVPLVLTLILGDIIPKCLGMQYNTSLSYYVAPLIAFLQDLLGPLRRLIIHVTFPISRFLFFFLRKEQNISRDELMHVLKTSQEHEVLSENEAELVGGYLDLQDSSVKELMRPRQDVLFYNLEEPLTKLISLFVDQRCSRIPVCRGGTLENLVGIIAAKDFFLRSKNILTNDDLLNYLSKPFFVPENSLARVLLRRFAERNEEISIVVDEYGSIAGLITREDVLEVIIGQIDDLRDKKMLYSRQSSSEIIMSGKLELDEFNAIFHSDLTSKNNMVTMGGWITESYGDIPKAGTKFESDGFLFHVLAAEGTRVRRIYVRKLKT